MDNNNRIDIDALKRRIRTFGWDNVLRAVCPEIDPVIGTNKRMACPMGHSRHGDAFRMWKPEDGGSVCNTCGTNRDGFATIMFVHNCAFMDAVRKIEDYLGTGARLAPRHVPTAVSTRYRDNDFIIANLAQVWNSSVDAMDESANPLRLYLINRGLTGMEIPPDLRFHPALPYWEKQDVKSVKTGEYPAMLALVRMSTGEPITIHRTYLTTEGGKACVPEVKKLMSSPSHKSLMGSAIRLSDDAPVLHATEGVENALAVRNLIGNCGHGFVSCVFAGMLAKFMPPAGTKIVVLWGDHDAGAGRNAVEAAAENLRGMGIRAIIMMPSFLAKPGEPKVDWNDAIVRHGLDGIRGTQAFNNLLRILDKESREAGIPARQVVG